MIAIATAVLQHLRTLTFTPYVTIAVIVFLVAVHQGLVDVVGGGNSGYHCLSAAKVLRSGNHFEVLYLWHILHLDDMHLYYNTLSFLHKGVQLERSRGPLGFARMLLLFTALTSVCYVLVGGVGEAIGVPGMLKACAVGWSGTIFALKAFLQAKDPGTSHIQGLSIPSKYAAWAELAAIQLVTPNASFIGHLAGILAGLAVLGLEHFIPAIRASHGWGEGKEPGP